MNLDARLMTEEPESVDEALWWVCSILSEQPHGKSAWQIEQEIDRARWLVAWAKAALRGRRKR